MPSSPCLCGMASPLCSRPHDGSTHPALPKEWRGPCSVPDKAMPGRSLSLCRALLQGPWEAFPGHRGWRLPGCGLPGQTEGQLLRMGCVQVCREDLWGSRGPSIPAVPLPRYRLRSTGEANLSHWEGLAGPGSPVAFPSQVPRLCPGPPCSIPAVSLVVVLSMGPSG